ncbi:uncharacterized protein LOC132905062 isoform X2 [Bombus pascuorum]|uniref:uncharacterized protein LOC132905062 isoform X2 n=1 Tax=Bombus pascuorum TaxID=65598 RepID=UPI00298DA084|nr:uncharacterized protein LOC132905062 isoform X2 [Bombus pascuorum]
MQQKKTVQLDILDTEYHNANIRINRLCPGCNLNKLEERIILCLKHSLPWIQRKETLQALDICRRCRQALYKLKADLQNLGLSRRQVHQGLIQLATKPHVVLTRQIPYRKYRFKNLSEDERGKNIIDNLRTNALNLRPQSGDIHKSNRTERFIKEENKYIKKTDGVTAYETALISSNRELFVPNICYKLKNPLATMHSFDETLKQLDENISSKMRVDEEFTNIRKLENNVVSSKKCDKNENHHCIREYEDTKKIQEISNLISDKVGSKGILMFNKYKKKHIESKLKLNSCFAKKVNDSIKSDDYKKVHTKSIKSDICKKLHNDKKIIDIKVNSIPNKNTYSKNEDSTLNCSHNIKEVTKMRENTHKRKLCKLVSDKHKEIAKKKRKIKDKFRKYFGDCISISEDEQEQNIIEEKFRKTREKDSVDSCESGVYVAERNITMTAAHVDIIQKSNDDIFRGFANVDASHKPNDDISQRTIANLDIIHKLNKNTSQETIVNVDTNYELNEDTSQRTIVNADVIHESDEDTSQGTILNVDTIPESNEITGNTNNKTTNQIEDATNFVEIECNKLQNNTYENKIHNIDIEKKELSRNKKFINFSEKNNIEKSKHASSVTDIFQITEQSKVNVSTAQIKATTEINNTLPSDIPEICISNHDTVAISKNFSGSERSNLDTKDFHMRSFKTCQIRSNGNVLSIQESDTNADVDINSNLKKLSEIQINCSQCVTEKILNFIEEDKEVQLSSNTNKTDNVISTNNVSNVKNNENKLAVKNFELSISDKKDIQSNKLSQGKLRVLSSAELGARWCPTPINSVTSNVQFSHNNTETQTVPETIVSVIAPVSETVNQTTIPENIYNFSQSVYVKIRNLIQNKRIFPINNLNYDKLLDMEFQKLRKLSNTDDFINLTKGVVTILNKEMLLTPPLTLDELFYYAPSVKSYYVQILNKNKTTINSLNEYQTVTSVGVPNQITLNQNRCCNAQVPQNIWASSVQSRLQYLLSTSSEQDQALRLNIVPNQPQQNFQEQIVLPLQNNVVQSNALVNPITMNNSGHNNMHQHTYRMQVHANFTQQKVSNVNFAKQNPVIGMHARQSYPLQYSLFPPTGRNQLGVHTSVAVTNASSMNQQYVSSVFIPQTNTYCNVNVPNYTIQQNMNSTHMSQGTQLQGVSRSVSPNRNISQPVQTMVAMNISNSVPKNSQHIEQKHRNVVPRKRIPMEALQNRTFKQVASPQQLKKKSTLRRLKKKENLQVSLESTTNLFDILKYISDIQKLILLKQLNYYFGCTTWLQQQFTSEKWDEIYSQRSALLHFQTLLKHLVEKTIKNLLPDKSQTNILKNIEIDVPKVIQITVQENNGICCQVEASKSNQKQYNAMDIKQNCTNYEKNSNVTITQNQCEKEHETTDNSQTNSSSIKQNLQSHQTSDVDVCQENKVGREPNSSKNIYNSNTKEQNLDESTKITENIPQIVKEKLSALSNMKLLKKDILQQLNPHLVTVEISSKNDQVTVVDTYANSENIPKSEEPEEYQEHQHLKGTITDDLTVSSFKSPNNIEYFNNKESHNASLERPPTTYIKDVRSISMEAYLRIGVTNNVPTNTMEENIEEEEIKICLYCGKPSTVACIICLEAKYCSKECSQLHWGDHYKDCSPVERSISL